MPETIDFDPEIPSTEPVRMDPFEERPAPARSGYDRDLAYKTRSHDASLPFVAERIRPALCAWFRGADDETSELL